MRLAWTLDRCRELYNAGLEERKTAYARCGVSVNARCQKTQLPAIKEVRPEYREIGSQVLQDVLERLDCAFQGFFRRVKAGHKPGYPRFKQRDRYNSFTFKQAGWQLKEGRLALQGIGAVKVRWSRPLAGTVKTVTVRREANRWYVCFACAVDIATPARPARPAVGIDVGLEHFATFSTGTHVANPRYLRRGEAVLARRQRRLARKKRGSRNRARAKLLVAQAQRTVRNHHHKEANTIIQACGMIAVEDLRIRNMVRNHTLAKSITDAGWAQFLAILAYKAEEAGVPYIAVDPRKTSQVCSGCGRDRSKDLSVRWHTCAQCGLSLQRDHNAALNILRAGQALLAARVA